MNKATIFAIICLIIGGVQAQVSSEDSLVEVSVYAGLPAAGERPVCLSELPNGNLCYSNLDGDIYEVSNGVSQIIFTDNDHHLSYVSHMEVKGDYMYLCGSEVQPGDTVMIGYVMKGQLSTSSWDTLAVSDPYYLGLSFNDHRFSSLLISQDGADVYVHSGTRTNSGEVQELPGVAGTVGLRWQAIRGKLFKLPTNLSETIHIPNDSSLLEASGYLYAEGLRHLFAMGWGTDGLMYGGSNSDRRDAPEAFYRLEAGGHYGYPWWIGGVQNPLQFPTYDPTTDLLLPSGANNQGYYDTDPNFPAMPTGITFSQPYQNIGPDADKYRDPQTGAVRDASDDGVTITSFSGHRSPVGLIFDQAEAFPNYFKGAGFMVSYTQGGRLLNDDGHDLVQIDLLPGDSMSVHQLVSGLSRPIDVMIKDSMLYVLDMGSGSVGRNIYEVRLLDSVKTNPTAVTPFSLASQVRLIPNPSPGKVLVQVDGPSPLKQVSVYDLRGKLYLSQADSENELDLSALPAQVYVVEIQLLNGERVVKKLKKE